MGEHVHPHCSRQQIMTCVQAFLQRWNMTWLYCTDYLHAAAVLWSHLKSQREMLDLAGEIHHEHHICNKHVVLQPCHKWPGTKNSEDISHPHGCWLLLRRTHLADQASRETRCISDDSQMLRRVCSTTHSRCGHVHSKRKGLMGPIVTLCGTHMLRRSDTRKAEMHSERMLCLNLELLRKHASLTHFFAKKRNPESHYVPPLSCM